MSKILTVYYSRKGENYFGGAIKSIEKGNTEIVAQMIQKAVGGELFEIDTTKAYSENYNTCTEEAMKELKANARPEIKGYVESLDDYDTIFVGYPNWWGTCPMCIFTFLENYNLSGKKIVPFCTNEGSGMGSSVKDLTKVCKGANVLAGLAIRGCQASDSEAIVSEWAKRNA